MRKDKREWAINRAQEAEDAAKCGQTKEEEVQQRWKEHFVELLNRPNPEREAKVITGMKVGKATGVDCLTVELLKADITTTVDVVHDLFCEVWVGETVPADWRRGLVIKIAKKGDLTKC